METKRRFFEELIRRALANGITRDAKLVMLGRMFEAMEEDALTGQEFRDLQVLLDVPLVDAARTYEFVLTGDDAEKPVPQEGS